MNRPLILVRFEPKPGMRDQVETVLAPMVPATRAEEGNLRYDLYGSTDAAGTALFWLIEQYTSDEAAAAHRETAHCYKDYRPRILPLLVQPPQACSCCNPSTSKPDEIPPPERLPPESPVKPPPGVSPADFAQAIRQWQGVVGADWVFTSSEDLDTYRDSYSPLYGEAAERVASAVVAPNSVEEVQKVLRIAHAARIPLYPISTGKNLTYGGSAPAYSGSVVLDLKRMNRILEVNERNAFALVEPGVSYFDLYRHIRERGLKLWIDCPDPGWGSPIGNSLDHGAGYTNAPFRDHFESRCGMEVVLADGELLRTGMGALPDSKTWQQFLATVWGRWSMDYSRNPILGWSPKWAFG